jgi:hypothetical protein
MSYGDFSSFTGGERPQVSCIISVFGGIRTIKDRINKAMDASLCADKSTLSKIDKYRIPKESPTRQN